MRNIKSEMQIHECDIRVFGRSGSWLLVAIFQAVIGPGLIYAIRQGFKYSRLMPFFRLRGKIRVRTTKYWEVFTGSGDAKRIPKRENQYKGLGYRSAQRPVGNFGTTRNPSRPSEEITSSRLISMDCLISAIGCQQCHGIWATLTRPCDGRPPRLELRNAVDGLNNLDRKLVEGYQIFKVENFQMKSHQRCQGHRLDPKVVMDDNFFCGDCDPKSFHISKFCKCIWIDTINPFR